MDKTKTGIKEMNNIKDTELEYYENKLKLNR